MKKQVLTVAEMRELDNYVINRDDAAIKLMGNAGAALSDELMDFSNIAVVCGPGNNGGDGFAAIYALQQRDFLDNKHVSIFYTREPKSEESKHFFENITHKNVRLEEFCKDCLERDFDVIVDCLLGTGFSGTPRGTIKEAIEAINARVLPARAMAAIENKYPKIISMDINSGVNGDSGDGEIAVKSNLTLSVGYLKVGMEKPCFKKWADEVKNVNIGYTEQDLRDAGILS